MSGITGVSVNALPTLNELQCLQECVVRLQQLVALGPGGTPLPANAAGQLTNNGAGVLSWVQCLTQALADLRYLQLTGGTLTGELIITQPNNTVALQLTGSSLTGANAQTLVDLVQTWNTSGAPTAIKLRITKTAADNAALLIDLGTVALGSLFKVDAFGGVTMGGATNGGQLLQIVGPFGTLAVRAGGGNDFGVQNTLSCVTGFGINMNNPAFLSWQAPGCLGIGAGNFDQSNGALRLNSVQKAADYTITLSDTTILVDCTAAARTMTLPTAVGCNGQTFAVKDWKGQAATNNITVITTGGQTIDGAATKVLSANGASFNFTSDGANWSIL